MRDALRGKVDHFFHLAAIYDMTADEAQNALLNVGGTQNAVDLANDLEAGIFHHASSIAVAGTYEGHFTEDMFDEGQTLPSPYHRTKFESEKLVRNARQGRLARVPAGDRRRRLAHRRDGQDRRARTTSSRRSRRRARRCRSGSRSIGLEVGWTNIVPVDWVAAAIDHIAHEPGLDGQAFHLVNPRPQRAGDVLNTFARAGHAPQMVLRVDKRMTDMLPKGVLSYAMKLPALKDVRRTLLADLGIPDRCSSTWRWCRASTGATRSARSRTPASRCRRWRPTPRSCGTTGSATSTRTCTRTARSPARSTARRS